uniref:F-box domain-containing protein n=1 Tax=Glossina austeni TaxID=7395 RepID=A0A1A9UMP4_GLOAU
MSIFAPDKGTWSERYRDPSCSRAVKSNGFMDTSPITQADNGLKIPALPYETWIEIFDNLSHGHLLQARLVCKSWYQMIGAFTSSNLNSLFGKQSLGEGKGIDLSKTSEDEIGLVDLPKFANLKSILMPLSDNGELFFQSLSNLTKMPTMHLGTYIPVLEELCSQNLDSGIDCCPEIQCNVFAN